MLWRHYGICSVWQSTALYAPSRLLFHPSSAQWPPDTVQSLLPKRWAQAPRWITPFFAWSSSSEPWISLLRLFLVRYPATNLFANRWVVARVDRFSSSSGLRQSGEKTFLASTDYLPCKMSIVNWHRPGSPELLWTYEVVERRTALASWAQAMHKPAWQSPSSDQPCHIAIDFSSSFIVIEGIAIAAVTGPSRYTPAADYNFVTDLLGCLQSCRHTTIPEPRLIHRR